MRGNLLRKWRLNLSVYQRRTGWGHRSQIYRAKQCVYFRKEKKKKVGWKKSVWVQIWKTIFTIYLSEYLSFVPFLLYHTSLAAQNVLELPSFTSQNHSFYFRTWLIIIWSYNPLRPALAVGVRKSQFPVPRS